MELIRIEGEYGFVKHSGKEFRVELSLIDNPQVGDWLLAHAEIAVNRVSSKDAKDILELISRSNNV
jgi:hydrogenase maturation factor